MHCLLAKNGGESKRVDDGDGLLVVIDVDERGRDDVELLHVLLDLFGGLGLDLLESLDDLEVSLGGDTLHRLGGHCKKWLLLVNMVFTLGKFLVPLFKEKQIKTFIKSYIIKKCSLYFNFFMNDRLEKLCSFI